jgi:tetratricopeptide (TPR) repeat protein
MPQETIHASKNELFNQALSFQQQQNWDEALKVYRTLLDQSRLDIEVNQASVVYHNMSIIALQKGDAMKAYAWAKKSYNLDSSNSVAKLQYQHMAKSFSSPSIPHQISNYDQVQGALEKVPADVIFFLTLAIIISSVSLALRVHILNRKAIIVGDRRVAKKWPVWLISICACFFIALSVIRLDATQKTKALVLEDQAPVQTVPGENKTVIFQAPAGLEVEVIGTHEGFIQVKHKGAFSGWIEKSKVEILSLRF